MSKKGRKNRKGRKGTRKPHENKYEGKGGKAKLKGQGKI